MSILTKKNGVALIAVLAILLILTLLIPAMFTMSETATEAAMRGTDQFRASYLARTMVEMSVAAFEDFYDYAEEGGEGSPYWEKMQEFLTSGVPINAQPVCMYRINNVPYPKEKPQKAMYETIEEYDAALKAFNAAIDEYAKGGIAYSTTMPCDKEEDLDNAVQGTKKIITYKDTDGNEITATGEYIGYAKCTITYDDTVCYYEIEPTGKINQINSSEEYKSKVTVLENLISSGADVSQKNQYTKIQNKNVVFHSIAKVNGKAGVRRCVMVLPTKPAEEFWIKVANLEVGCNQIFPDAAQATGRTSINYPKGVNGAAMKQPLFIFSCIGNMVISDEDLKVKRKNKDGVEQPISYIEYLRENNASYRQQDMSFGLHPETGTREPDNDPAFNCLRTYNMNSWSGEALQDNFVAYTATNAIQVDLPVNLLVNPARTGRIGDGLDPNSPLYKVLIFQAPTIIFNKPVNSMISLNVERNDAYRMTTIMFAAPKNTPYSYVNGSRNKKVVKAGKVFFAEDAYIWVIPFEDNGSGYNTQTVYYKNDDIILYKIANAGDIYYFNAEVETNINGKQSSAGFSMTGYFMDVLYEKQKISNNSWWQVWGNIKQSLYNRVVESKEDTYLPDDFKFVGNVYDGTGEQLPVVDDFYVIWDS